MRKLLIIAIFFAACSPDGDDGFVLRSVEIDGVQWADRNLEKLFVFGQEPCPAGWRVPTIEELKLLAGKAAAVNYVNDVQAVEFRDGVSGNSVILPLAGYRLPGSDVINGEGSYGCYWSSTAGDTGTGLCLTIFISPKNDKVTIIPEDAADVGIAQSVRCIKE